MSNTLPVGKHLHTAGSIQIFFNGKPWIIACFLKETNLFPQPVASEVNLFPQQINTAGGGF